MARVGSRVPWTGPSGLRTLLLPLVLLVATSEVARADVELPVIPAPAPRVRVDGWHREWPTRQFVGIGGDPASRMRFAFAVDAAGLYVAASVDDDRVVRSSSPSATEDAVVVTLVGTGERGPVTTELWLYAGVVDQTAARLTIGGTAPRAASIVEMPTASGYDLEAFVPWAAIPSVRDYAGMRAAARLHDVDRAGTAARDVGSAASTTLPRVVGTAGDLFPLTSFLRAKGATTASIEAEVRANFAGDATPERVVVVAGSVAIVGSSYANGRDFDYVDLGVPAGAITDLRAVDLDGDARNELLLVSQIGDARLAVRELRVYRFPGDRIAPLFRGEIALVSASGRLESPWTVETVARRPVIVIRAAEPQGTPPGGHVAAPDSRAVLSVASGFRSRTFGFDASGASVIAEEPIPVVAAAPAPARPAPTPAPTPAPRPTPPAASPARPAAPAFDPEALLAAVRRDRRIAADVPTRFATDADVAEDSRSERIAVLGRTVVVSGPGYRGGRGYLALDLGVPTADFVVGLSAADVTGDGKAEVWARVRQSIGTPAQPYWLELLIVYRVEDGGLVPILTAQIGLGDASRSVRNEARVVGRGRSLQLALGTGSATGFDARSFPFATTATPGMTTLLLPWRDREVRYRWDGHAIVTP